MNQGLVLNPLLPWQAILILAAVAVPLVVASRQELRWWLLRLAVLLVLLVALANPTLKSVLARDLPDIVLLVTDHSRSQEFGQRTEMMESVRDQLRRDFEESWPETTLVEIAVRDTERGSELLTAISDEVARIDSRRLAGIILVTDGQAHDHAKGLVSEVPVHVLLTGEPDAWDRQLELTRVPAYAVVNEEIILKLRLLDHGFPPAPSGAPALVSVTLNDDVPQSFEVRPGEEFEIPLVFEQAGPSIVYLEVPQLDGELTDRNNRRAVTVQGVRDRLRVLLVSGSPHPGQRTWRNLLKSDSSVELIHFTILRYKDNYNPAPEHELALISFPVRELFLEQIDKFDLIIFDRYERRGLLSPVYYSEILNYVERGGSVLVSAGPEYAGVSSIYRTVLAEMLPGAPTGILHTVPYRPSVTDLGTRHPVTAALNERGAADGERDWGRWLRQVELESVRGQVLMEGIREAPLLVLQRFGKGRVALFASDHAWLWNRGFEGGGPQQELLRRLTHWMMKEPDLEEERLAVVTTDSGIKISRRSLSSTVEPAILNSSDHETMEVNLQESEPGLFEATVEGLAPDIYRVENGSLSGIAIVGASDVVEFSEVVSTERLLGPIAERSGGSVTWIEDGVPSIRFIQEGQATSGRSWIGLRSRGVSLVEEIRLYPLIHPLLYMILAAGLLALAWWQEGRRSSRVR